jgi:hypothetical protein
MISSLENSSVNIAIYNQMGQMVSNVNVDLNTGKNNVELSTNDLPAGIYTVSVSNSNSVVTRRLIIQK